MEKMTAAEKKLLRELQAKEKRVMRAEAEFLKEADSRKDELLKRWEISDRLEQAAELIGTDSDTLFAWITSDIQVRYFRQTIVRLPEVALLLWPDRSAHRTGAAGGSSSLQEPSESPLLCLQSIVGYTFPPSLCL